MTLTEAIKILESNNYAVNGNIRECTYEEFLIAVTNMFKELFPNSESIESNISPYISYWKQRLHAYTIDGKQCFLLYSPKEYEDTRDYNYLVMTYVNPEARGTGIAVQLMKKCIQDSPNGLMFNTMSRNTAMIRLAQKTGFTIEKDRYWTTGYYNP